MDVDEVDLASTASRHELAQIRKTLVRPSSIGHTDRPKLRRTTKEISDVLLIRRGSVSCTQVCPFLLVRLIEAKNCFCSGSNSSFRIVLPGDEEHRFRRPE